MFCRKRKDNARALSSVELVTESGSHLLPLQDTLLRGSDLPPTGQQAELLRAAQAGLETPAEELLRSSSGETLSTFEQASEEPCGTGVVV